MIAKTLIFEDGESLLKFVRQHPEGILSVKILPNETVEVRVEFIDPVTPVNRLISLYGSNQFRLRSEK
jgi:hypothetical protein